MREKAAVIQGRVDAGRMAPVDSTHLFFTICAATQTYADFEVQISAVLGAPSLEPEAPALTKAWRGWGWRFKDKSACSAIWTGIDSYEIDSVSCKSYAAETSSIWMPRPVSWLSRAAWA